MRAWALLSLTLAASSFASSPVERALIEHMAKGVPAAKVGDWVTYQLSGGPRKAFLRLSVVAEEKDDQGREAQWLEMELGEHHLMKSPMAQIRMLVAKGEGMNKDGVTRMFWGGPFDPPQELSRDSLAFAMKGDGVKPRPASHVPPQMKADVKLTSGDEQRLLTLAGTVAAVPVEVRYRSTVIQRFWLSRQIPVLQLAKLEIPAIHHAMEVRDFGTNAKPLMRLPPKGAPKVEMHAVEENFPWGKLQSPPEVSE